MSTYKSYLNLPKCALLCGTAVTSVLSKVLSEGSWKLLNNTLSKAILSGVGRGLETVLPHMDYICGPKGVWSFRCFCQK